MPNTIVKHKLNLAGAQNQWINEHNIHPIYRPDIDGLRALAIISVVIFHAFPSAMPGGFVGVDVFFVISGFLISTIILKSLNRNDFSFIEFYIHRVQRISLLDGLHFFQMNISSWASISQRALALYRIWFSGKSQDILIHHQN